VWAGFSVMPVSRRICFAWPRCAGTGFCLKPFGALSMTNIAATALISQLPLVTHNVRHFPMLKGLKRPY
jgi:predicted nucleic acid-binding protein